MKHRDQVPLFHLCFTQPSPEGVNEDFLGVLDFGSGQSAQFRSRTAHHVQLLGTRGTITVPRAFVLRRIAGRRSSRTRTIRPLMPGHLHAAARFGPLRGHIAAAFTLPVPAAILVVASTGPSPVRR
ncbi:MAG TPA: hypothetical protein VFI18_06615 [Gaiellales bacterium]|nr:hypothetical protein [Gaiellales bacterium]